MSSTAEGPALFILAKVRSGQVFKQLLLHGDNGWRGFGSALREANASALSVLILALPISGPQEWWFVQNLTR